MVKTFAFGVVKTSTEPKVLSLANVSISANKATSLKLPSGSAYPIATEGHVGLIVIKAGFAGRTELCYMDTDVTNDTPVNPVTLFPKGLVTTTLTEWEYYANVPLGKYLALYCTDAGSDSGLYAVVHVVDE